MIIEVKKQLDIQSIGVETESIGASIDAASMPFLFEMLSGSLYSNPIGSICREITSNCFDSHIEANIDDPVTIKKGWDEEGYYISFVDIGVGLSPERIQSIYMNYFSSTKRETNSLIGGFGLGSKSPLSYTDYFYINTTFDNVKYQYIFSKGKTIPTLDLLDRSEIFGRNGTEIRIYIKDDDVYKFKNELIKQLCYFDNVYFEGWDIENDYTIFEGKYFKYRNKNQYSTKMHIVLDKVVYPIDWKQLGIPEYNIAIGVKFQIGELLVTPNREQLRYTDEIITLLKERINQTIEELVSIFDKQNTKFDSFFDWLEVRNEKPYITFNKEGGAIDKLYLYGLEYVNKKNIYKYFEGIEDISNISDIVSLFFSYLGEVNNGKRKKKESYYTPDISYKIRYNPSSCHISDKPYTNIEKDWLMNSGYVIYPKINKLKEHKNIFLSTVHNDLAVRLDNYYFNLGAGLRIYKLMKALREEVKLRCKVYRELTEQELLEYKEEKKRNDGSLQRRLNGKVLVDSLNEINKYDWSLQTNKEERYWTKGINTYTGIVIYGFREDQQKLEKAMTLLYLVKRNYFKTSRNRNHIGDNRIFKVIKISKQNEKYFKKRSNMIHVDNLYGDNPMFRDMTSSFKIEQFFNDIEQCNGQHTANYIEQIKLICTDVGEVLEQLYNFYLNTNKDNYDLTYKRYHIKDEVMRIAEKYNLYNPNVELLFSKVNDWFKGIEIIRYTNINDKTLPYVLKLLYEKKKRLNIEYYQKVLNTDNTTQLSIDFDRSEIPSLTKFTVITQNLIV
jgi:hypothetical protein